MAARTFKEQLAADLNTFLNPDEFANEHMIDDRLLPAVVDVPTDNPHPFDYAEGVSLVRKVVYVEAAFLGYMPCQNQGIKLDGQRFTVAKVAEEAGIIAIFLEANAG